MGSAFWFLMRRSARNRLLRVIKRLQEPRYLIALLAGMAYLWFFLFNRPAQAAPASKTLIEIVPLLGSLGILVAVARWWIFGTNRSALSFSPAEIQFLFPAPITRTALLRWKLLRWQLVIAVNAIIWIVIARRSRPPIPLLFYAVSLWAVLSTLSMHRLGSALARAGVGLHWRTGLRRQAVPITLALAAILGVAAVFALNWSALADTCCGAEFVPILRRVVDHPAVAVVLFPFRLLMAPLGATTISAWAQAILPALALLALHYIWVVRSQVAFEEASVRASQEMTQRIARMSRDRNRVIPTGRVTRGPSLRPLGWPGGAILWKNTLAVIRGNFSRSGVIGFMVIAGVFIYIVSGEPNVEMATAIGYVALGLAAILVVFGSVWIRNDLRQDLHYLGLLRSYPLRGRTIVLAEIASSTIALTLLEYVFLIGGYLGVSRTVNMNAYVPHGLFLSLTLPIFLVINGMSLTMHNAAALLFPDWVQVGTVRPGGFETLGQNILSSLFTALLFVASLLIPAWTGLLARAVLRGHTGTAAPFIAGAIALGVAVAEFILLIGWLGRVFERTESI